MALITCSECGKEFSDKADKCPNCGCPNPNAKETVVEIKEKYKGFCSAGRLTIGIISIVLFVLISFQSCAAGISNALEENGASSGSSGFFLAVFMLIAGIVGICTRNSRGKAGAITATVLYWISASCSLGQSKTYGDIAIWGTVSFIFGLFFLICAIKTKKNKAENVMRNEG